VFPLLFPSDMDYLEGNVFDVLIQLTIKLAIQ